MNPLRAFLLRFGHRPTDPETLRRACAATRKAWDEARAKTRGVAGSA